MGERGARCWDLSLRHGFAPRSNQPVLLYPTVACTYKDASTQHVGEGPGGGGGCSAIATDFVIIEPTINPRHSRIPDSCIPERLKTVAEKQGKHCRARDGGIAMLTQGTNDSSPLK